MTQTSSNGLAMPALAVTGVTGALGGAVAQLLADNGMSQRLLVRDPARAPTHPEATVVQCAYGDEPVARRALHGVTTLFMVSASESPDRLDQPRRFIDAAAWAGVQHIVYPSFTGAAPDAIFTLA